MAVRLWPIVPMMLVGARVAGVVAPGPARRLSWVWSPRLYVLGSPSSCAGRRCRTLVGVDVVIVGGARPARLARSCCSGRRSRGVNDLRLDRCADGSSTSSAPTHVLVDQPICEPGTRWTGPVAITGSALAVVRPGRHRRGRAVVGACADHESRSCPRAATPGSSAERCRRRARSCCRSRDWPTSEPVDVDGRPGDRRGRRHARRGRRGRPGDGLGVRRRPRGPRHGDDRRHDRHQRRRGARAALRLDAGQRARRRGGARRRLGRQPARRAAQGQHRLRPGRAAVRQRGHARDRHRGAAAARPRTGPNGSPSGSHVARGPTRWSERPAAGCTSTGSTDSRRSTPPARPSPRNSSRCRPLLDGQAGRRAARRLGRVDVPRARLRRAGRRSGVVGRRRRRRNWLRLWAPRERQAEAIARIGIPHKLDVTVPVAATRGVHRPRVLDEIARPHRLFLFGHLGDGNLHVNVVGPGLRRRADRRAGPARRRRHGGSISAEHGIGRAKRRWLHLSRQPEELAAFRAIKQALDPTGHPEPGRAPAERRLSTALVRRRPTRRAAA